jgi:hypothetical protein
MPKISARTALVVVVVVVAGLGGLALVVSHDGSKASGDAASSTVVSSVDPGQTGDTTTTSELPAASSTSLADTIETAPKEPVSKDIPLAVVASNTTDLRDGDTVTVRVTPKDPGKVVYGFEMFICADGSSFQLDADIRPTFTGKCIEHPLSTSSGDYVKVAAAAPYQSADGTMKVGVGTDSYTTQNGKSVTIACGPGHPCLLVLKLQFQDAYGFQALPLTFG